MNRGYQQMNQADSENKCSKRISNESILKNYNFDDVSTDQRSICENCKQRGWTVCGKHSSHVGTVSNTEHVIEVAEVSQQQQEGTNNLCAQSLLQKAWVYLQSVITSRMSGCPRCNPKSPSSTSIKSPSQSSRSSPSESSSKSILSCQQSCLNYKKPCSRGRSRDILHNPRTSSFSSYVKPLSSKVKQTNPRPKTKPTSPHAKPSCLNADCRNPKCANAKPSSKKLQAPSPNAKCPNAKPSCTSLQPPCSHAKPSSSKDKSASLYAKPPCLNAKCPNAKPSCLSLQLPCPKANPSNSNLKLNSKTSLYHSFSKDSLCSKCKESLVELAKVYIHKLTSEHKITCPRCAKQSTSAISKETMASYLRSIFDQAWSYFFNKSIEQNPCPPQCVLSNSSNTSTSTRISESPSPDNSRCCCSKSPKTQSREAVCRSKPVSTSKSVTIPDRATCPICLKPASTKPVTCLRPVSCPTCFKPATCAKPATCPMFYNIEGTISPAQRFKEEENHEHKSCYTPCSMRNSQGVQPSYNMSEKPYWASQTSMSPFYISPSQVKTPESVGELKASITGVTCLDTSSANILACDILDFRSTIEYSNPCVRDLRDLICATDIIPLKDMCFSLTLEQQKDHTLGSHSKDLKHSKASLDNCEETMNSCNDLEEKIRKEEAPCPSSGGRVKSNEVLLDTDFDNPTEEVHSKEKICKSGRNSVTCVDSNQPDPKDCNAPEKEADTKDPYNYRYYY